MGKKKGKLDQKGMQGELMADTQRQKLLRITQQAAEDMGIFDLGLRVNVQFHDGYFGGWDQAEEGDLSAETTAATTTTSFQYQTSQIIWYLPPTYDQSDKWLYDIAVHELCHVLQAPVKDSLLKSENMEFYTEWLTRSFLSMKKAGEDARS